VDRHRFIRLGQAQGREKAAQRTAFSNPSAVEVREGGLRAVVAATSVATSLNATFLNRAARNAQSVRQHHAIRAAVWSRERLRSIVPRPGYDQTDGEMSR